MQEILLATGNPGKASEVRQILADLPVRILTSDDGYEPISVNEDQDTLEGNARKKAMAWHRVYDVSTIADDTALEVDALNGKPGVRSARFAGENVTDAENRELLLAQMSGESKRGAQFRTVIAWVFQGEVVYANGVCRGTIAREERGSEGFGYDSIFIPEGFDRTFAELPPEQKNAISHRSRALKNFSLQLKELLNHGSAGPAS